jgi:hypothetical protein
MVTYATLLQLEPPLDAEPEQKRKKKIGLLRSQKSW